MNLARTFLEARAGLRYRLSQAQMPILRAGFGHVGEGTVVIRPLMLTGIERVSLGSNVLMREDAWIAAEGTQGSITIGDNCYFGFRSHIHSIDPVSIGRGCVIADNVMVTTTDHERGDRHGVTGTGPVVIGDNVFLGQNVVVLGGVTIGDGATVAAGAIVVKDVPAGSVVGGVPAKVVRTGEGSNA